MPEEIPDPEGSENLNEPPPFFPSDLSEAEYGDPGTFAEVEVEGVFAREDGANREHFVVVRDGYRRLSIIIDPCNANAISLPLDGAVPDRPLTHDLIKRLLDRMGAEIDRVLIDDLSSATYYAKLRVRVKDEEFDIDCRPSDAIAIAVRYQASIYVAESIMETASD